MRALSALEFQIATYRNFPLIIEHELKPRINEFSWMARAQQ